MPRRSLIALLAIAVVAVAAIAAVLLRPEPSAEVMVQLDWTVDDSCPDAVVVGAAGSGQRDDILGVGPQVESAVAAFSTQLTSQSAVSIFAGFMALDYPAPGILEGTLQGLSGNGMFDSIAQGRTTLTSLIATIGDRCEDSIIYLVGFSQGASVVHSTVVELPAEYWDSIGGAVVLADPYRDADDPNALHFTTEPDADAVGAAAPHTHDGSLTGVPLPDWIKGSFYSACALRDTVCNFALRDLLITSEVHTDETYNGLGPEMGKLLADKLLQRQLAAQ